MRICSSYLHSRKEVSYDEVGTAVRMGVKTALTLAGMGNVMTTSWPVPRHGKCIVDVVGTDLEWGVPLVNVVRAADASLFAPEEDDGEASGSMTSVVETVGHGTVEVGGKKFETEDDGFLMPGMRVRYVVEDGMLQVLEVVERGISVGPYYKAAGYSGTSTYTFEGENTPSAKDAYGVTVGMDGDTLVVRMLGRNGIKGSAILGDVPGHEMSRRMKAIGATEEITPQGPLWRIDLSTPYTGDKGTAWASLVNLGRWLLDADGAISGEAGPTFAKLRNWAFSQTIS